MSKLKNLRELLEHQVKDLYSAESQLLNALPQMVRNTKDTELTSAINNHLKETENHKKRLEQVASYLNISPEGETCKAMQGLIKEGTDMIHEEADQDVKDAGLIAECQRVEHYEISGYGTANHYAKMLGLEDVQQLLEETLEEEKDADEKLNDIAIQKVNKYAMKND